MFDIDYIAKLSKLNPENVKKYSEQMRDIISLADEILSADSDTLSPVTSDYCCLRPDITQNFNSKELLKNSEAICDNCFTVPKII